MSAGSESRSSSPPSKEGRARLNSRTESSTTLLGDSARKSSMERKASRPSISLTPRTSGMNIFKVVAAAKAWKNLAMKKKPEPEKPKVKLENTYRLGPHPGETFKPDKVEKEIKEILGIFLRTFKYSPEASKRMCMSISSEITQRVKRMNFPRYKIVCNVIIMQNKGQGSQVSSRSVWNTSTDSFASHTYKSPQFTCTANVHAVYYE